MKINNNYVKIANFIERSPKTQKVLRFADKNPAIFQSSCVFALTTVLRPASIMAIPSKTKDGKADAKYSSARSIATGVVDLVTSTAIFVPLNKAIDSSTRKLFEVKNSVFYHHKENCSAFKSLFNRGTKIMVLPLIAFLNFHYVKKIADILFRGKTKRRQK